MVRRNTATGICEQGSKSIKNNQNGAQMKRTLDRRDMWDKCTFGVPGQEKESEKRNFLRENGQTFSKTDF